MAACKHKLGLGALLLDVTAHADHHVERVRRLDDDRVEATCCCGVAYVAYATIQANVDEGDCYRYIVSGVGAFPFDGLAVARAWPSTVTDTKKLTQRGVHVRTVTLVAIDPPDMEWWAQARWPVAEVHGPHFAKKRS